MLLPAPKPIGDQLPCLVAQQCLRPGTPRLTHDLTALGFCVQQIARSCGYSETGRPQLVAVLFLGLRPRQATCDNSGLSVVAQGNARFPLAAAEH